MTGREIFKIWAPSGARWAEWVRPVPFVTMDHPEQVYRASNFTIPGIAYMEERKTDTGIILDLPGYGSVEEGLALAKLGFRPIPLYNGTNEQQGAAALVDNHMISRALVWGALELNALQIADPAPPAFLLDSNRTHRFKMNVSMFDNSWDLYSQDMPSPEYCLEKGIKKMIVRGETIQKDLVNILYKYQQKGIHILFTKGYEEPKEKVIKKPRQRTWKGILANYGKVWR